LILRLTVISSKQSFRYNKMYKSNLDPGEGNAKDGVRRTPSFLNMYVPGPVFLKSPVKEFRK
jgi:hypothetical protein